MMTLKLLKMSTLMLKLENLKIVILKVMVLFTLEKMVALMVKTLDLMEVVFIQEKVVEFSKIAVVLSQAIRIVVTLIVILDII